jgi:hypothetical protein
MKKYSSFVTNIALYLFGTMVISDWNEGSPLLFTGEWNGKQYTDKGMILKKENEKILQYSYWSSFSPLPDLPENYSVLTFTLSPAENTTVLTLVQEGFSDEQASDHSGENWSAVLKTMKEIVEKK